MTLTAVSVLAALRRESRFGLSLCLDAIRRVGNHADFDVVRQTLNKLAIAKGQQIQGKSIANNLNVGLVCFSNTESSNALFKIKCQTDFALRSSEVGELSRVIGESICNKSDYTELLLMSVCRLNEPIAVVPMLTWPVQSDEHEALYVHQPHEANDKAGQRISYVSVQAPGITKESLKTALRHIAMHAAINKITSMDELLVSCPAANMNGRSCTVKEYLDKHFGADYTLRHFYYASVS